MRTWYLLCFSILFTSLQAQTLPPKEAYPLQVKQIHSGHSLTDPLFHPWPGIYVELMTEQIGQWALDHIGKSTTPGSSMSYRWDNPPCCGAPDARHDIDEWEVLVITERVPLYYEGGSTAEWYLEGLEDQRTMMATWANHAWAQGDGGNGAPTLLWSTWTNIDDSDGPWRAMLDVLGAEWEHMQDIANDQLPSGATPVYMIPGHKMMARLYDDIQAGIVPDVTHISDFFSDNIHVNDLGAYAVALIHYACLFNASPVGLPYDFPSESTVPTPALAAYLQHMIWEVVTTYPRTGLTDVLSIYTTDLSASIDQQMTTIHFSVPNRDQLHHIELQHKSKASKSFQTIHTFADNTAKKYSYIHQSPDPGTNLYRIKLTDLSGNHTYSNVKAVQMVTKLWDVFPSLVNQQLFIQSMSRHNGQYVLSDINGNRLQSGPIASTLDMDHLPLGTYYLTLYDASVSEIHRVVRVE